MMTRTTIRINQALLDELKMRSLKSRRSLAATIEGFLRLGIKAADEPQPFIDLPIFGGCTGPAPGINLDDTSELLEMSEKNYVPPRSKRAS
jgi:hypothetical protein